MLDNLMCGMLESMRTCVEKLGDLINNLTMKRFHATEGASISSHPVSWLGRQNCESATGQGGLSGHARPLLARPCNAVIAVKCVNNIFSL